MLRTGNSKIVFLTVDLRQRTWESMKHEPTHRIAGARSCGGSGLTQQGDREYENETSSPSKPSSIMDALNIFAPSADHFPSFVSVHTVDHRGVQ